MKLLIENKLLPLFHFVLCNLYTSQNCIAFTVCEAEQLYSVSHTSYFYHSRAHRTFEKDFESIYFVILVRNANKNSLNPLGKANNATYNG